MIITDDNKLVLGGGTTQSSFAFEDARLIRLYGPTVGLPEMASAQGISMITTGLLSEAGNVVNVQGVDGQKVRLDLLDALGRRVHVLYEGVVPVDGRIYFDLPGSTVHGHYLLQASYPGGWLVRQCIR